MRGLTAGLARMRDHPRASLFLLAAFAFALLVRMPGLMSAATLTDEGARIAAAQPIAHGAVIYRAVVGVGPPGSILFNALWLLVSGDSLEVVRVAYLMISVLNLVLVAALAWRLLGPLSAAVSAGLGAVSPQEAQYAYHAMTEPLMLTFVLAALLVVSTPARGRRPWRFAAAGALGVLAMQVKQPGAVVLVALGAVELYGVFRHKDGRDRVTNLVGLTGGVAAALSVWLVYAGACGLVEMWVAEMTTYGSVTPDQLHAYFDVPDATDPKKATQFLVHHGARRAFVPLGFVGMLLLRDPRLAAVRAVAAIMFVAVYLLPLNYDGGLSHYLLMFEPFWIVLAGGVVARAVAHRDLGTRDRATSIMPWLVGLVVLVTTVPTVQDLNELRPRSPASNELEAERSLAQFLTDEESALVLANPIYYFHASRQPPTRPLDYFLLFRLTRMSISTPAFADEISENALRSAEVILLDMNRGRMLHHAIMERDLPVGFELITATPRLRLCRVLWGVVEDPKKKAKRLAKGQPRYVPQWLCKAE